MLNWLTENSMVPMITGLMLTAAFLALALLSYDKTMFRIGLAIALLTGLIVGVENWIVTDREQVESIIRRLATAVERNDTQTILAHISSTKEELKNRVPQEMKNYRITNCRIIDFLSFQAKTDSDPHTAESVFVVFAAGEHVNGLRGSVHERVKLTFQKDPGTDDWRLSDYAHEHARLESHSF